MSETFLVAVGYVVAFAAIGWNVLVWRSEFCRIRELDEWLRREREESQRQREERRRL